MTDLKQIEPLGPVAPGEFYYAWIDGRRRTLKYDGLSYDGDHHISALHDQRFSPSKEVRVIHHEGHDNFRPNPERKIHI